MLSSCLDETGGCDSNINVHYGKSTLSDPDGSSDRLDTKLAATRSPQPGVLSQGPSARNPQPGVSARVPLRVPLRVSVRIALGVPLRVPFMIS